MKTPRFPHYVRHPAFPPSAPTVQPVASPPAGPTLVKPSPSPHPAAKTVPRRKTSADWVTASGNGLAWRVIANRRWKHHFGQGLVASPSNVGFTGAKPTHPDLLDYLARQLIANGGRFQALHKLFLLYTSPSPRD